VPSCIFWRVNLILLSCLLTLAASGDDCCLLRIVFPGTFATAETLPLDDPNTDFVQASGTATAHGCAPDRDASQPAPWPDFTGVFPGIPPLEVAHLSSPDPIILVLGNTPLRC
jgi:hypothetical protein